MLRNVVGGLLCLALFVGFFAQPAVSQKQNIEPRIAFVVGNSAYERGPIENALNDAGLVAEALRSIGFEIVEGADLGQQDFLRSFGDFLGKVEAAGPEAIAFVYFSGYGIAFEGENFLVPADARLDRDSDIPLRALRLSDLMRSLAASPARAKVFAIDAARPLPFNFRDAPLAIGLAALEAPQGVLVAFSAGPGTVAEDPPPPSYGPFATALAEMLRTPGLDLDALFVRVRTRAHQLTEGRQTPWHVTGLAEPVVLVADDVRADATVSAPPPPPRFEREVRPMREIGPDESYAMAIELDTLDGYTEFIESYPRHAYTGRIYAIIRARREALAWLRARQINTPESYWTYLMRYPDGVYAFDARRRLRRLSAAFAPPPGFAPVEFYDVPPPLADEPVEYIYVERFVGPPPPRILIAPPPAFFIGLVAPRAAPRGARFRGLPQTVSIPVIQQVSPARRPDFQQRRQERLQQQQRTTTTSPSAPGTTTPPAATTTTTTPAATASTSVVPVQPGVPDSRRRPGRPPLQASAPATQPAPGAASPAPSTAPGARPVTPPVTPPSATAPTQPDPRRPSVPPAAATPPAITPPPAASAPPVLPPGARPVPPPSTVTPSPTDPRRLPPPPASATAPGTAPPPAAAPPSPTDPRRAPGLPRPPASATAPTSTPPPAAAPRPVDPRRMPPTEQRRLPQPPPAASAPAEPGRGPPPPGQAAPPPRAAPPPPPPAATRPLPPPPPPTAAAPPPQRPAPPPPPAARPAPPPPAARAAPPPPPPAAAKPAPAPAKKKCEVKDGKEVCQ